MIDLTPLDVRKKKGDFTRALRGYEPAAVDEFLDLVAERMEELVRENTALRERSAQLVEAVNGYRGREQAMNEALISAQQLREDVKAQAAREADLVVREAHGEGERIRAQARREAEELFEATRRAQAQRTRFLRSFRAFLERQLEEVALEEERLRNGAPRPEAEAGRTATQDEQP